MPVDKGLKCPSIFGRESATTAERKRYLLMDLMAYWRWDNYINDLNEGARFNFNSNQSRLHWAIEKCDE